MDTGANINVLPLQEYIRVTNDVNGKFIKKNKYKTISAYGDKQWPIKGELDIKVSRGKHSILIRILIIHAILGRRACIELKCINILDSDAQQTINTIINTNTSWKQEYMRREYADAFDNKLGRIQGKYKISLEENYVPVKHCQRTVSAPLQEKVKQKLEELEKNDIIERIREPTEWISSMVVVRKKNDDIRICLDPKDLNKIIQREHYPLPDRTSSTTTKQC